MSLIWYGKFAPVSAAVSAAALASAPPALAADASWGCQVLLCGAASNPSWQGVPYCVPPMTKLIAAMKLPGFSWPICAEGNAGKPGRDDYEPCPQGWSPVARQSAGESARLGVASLCEKALTIAELHALQRGAGKDGKFGNSAMTVRYESYGREGNRTRAIGVQARKKRADPYYFDVPNSQGIKRRFWFNLNL